MIYLEIKGRLGNQFFIYAFARKLQMERGNKDKLVLGLSDMKGKNAAEGWCDSLKDFNVQPYTICKHRLVYVHGSLLQKILDSIFSFDIRILTRNVKVKRIRHTRKWLGLLNRFGLIHNEDEYYEYTITKVDKIFIKGTFQSPQYLASIRDVLLKEFVPKYDLLPENKEFYELIKSTNSICISIRRGDFLKLEYNQTFYLCSENYFLKAVEIIKSKVDNPTFFVFSDEVEWAKKNLDFGCVTYYERGCDPLWEKVRLMSACKHFILSNSSFSWMVQFLSDYPEKIVISPSRWYNDDTYPNNLVDDSFIKIEV